MPDMKKKPMVKADSKEKDRQMSAVLRGARTMGPGRGGRGEAASAALKEQMMMDYEPMPGSSLPSGLSGVAADQMVSDMRMAALLKAMQDAQRLPGPTVR
jgi:hypothetical protein